MDYDFFAQQLRDMQRSGTLSDLQNSSQDSEMPTIEPTTSSEQPAATTSTTTHDVEMRNEEDDIPDLESISNSSGSASDSDSESEANEVEMEAVDDDPPLPVVEPIATNPRPNRRTRVDDDDDDDRDRRHPSERVSTPLAGPSSSSSSRTPSNAPHNRRGLHHFFPFPSNFAPPSSTGAPNTNRTNTAQEAANETGGPAADPQDRFPFLTGGVAFSFDIDPPPAGAVGNAEDAQPQANGNPNGGPAPDGPNSFADFFNHPGFLNDLFGIEPDVEDPERAERLINGLEDVPEGLVKRLERVGGMTGANGTELSGGDSGCAVCWEKLLDVEVTETELVEGEKEKKEGEEEAKPTRIVSLPCAHVFHAECLRPWFSRPKQTTCPTCRFNIDPENLTYVPYRQRRRAQQRQGQANPQPQAQDATPAPTSDEATAPTAEAAAVADPAPVAGPSTVVPVAEPQPGQSTQAASPEPARGRPGPSAIPPNIGAQVRRPNSEPPTNRRPRGAFGAESVHSFAVPGGHVVIVSNPFGILTDPQGRPTGGTGQQSQGNTANDEPVATPAAAVTTSIPPTNANSQPVFGPPPPPNARPNPFAQLFGGADGQLPQGVVAFDVEFPLLSSLFGPPPNAAAPGTQAQPQVGQPQQQPAPARDGQPAVAQQPPPVPRPEIRLPQMGFAGVNFGNRQQPPASISQFLRTLFQPPRANATDARANANPVTNTAATRDAGASTNASAAPSTSGTNPSSTPATARSPETSRASTPSGPDEHATAAASGAATPEPQPAASTAGGAVGAPTEEQRRVEEEAINFIRGLSNTINTPQFLLRLLMSAAASFPPPGAPRAPRTGNTNTLRKDWTPPPAPGPTLRQRVEKKEREAGLRCYDVSCGVGPSDEEPLVALSDTLSKQLSIRPKGNEGGSVCAHTFHSSCLVSAERVASKGADAAVVDGVVEVSCPVCRGVGTVSKGDWDEGVVNLQ